VEVLRRPLRSRLAGPPTQSERHASAPARELMFTFFMVISSMIIPTSDFDPFIAARAVPKHRIRDSRRRASWSHNSHCSSRFAGVPPSTHSLHDSLPPPVPFSTSIQHAWHSWDPCSGSLERTAAGAACAGAVRPFMGLRLMSTAAGPALMKLARSEKKLCARAACVGDMECRCAPVRETKVTRRTWYGLRRRLGAETHSTCRNLRP